MGSPVTLSGFNQIDFSQILELVMQQERLPVTQLESQKKIVDAQKSAFSTLATRLAAFESAAEALQAATAFDGTKATSSDAAKVSVSASSTAPAGTYEVQVLALAKSQVSLSSAVASADTVVARSGSITVGAGARVDVPAEGYTLAQLASAINDAEGGDVNASVVKTADGYALMLTGRNTGAANGFTVTNALADGDASLTITQQRAAADASVQLNGVTISSPTNTFQDVIAGASFTVLQETANPVVVTITASNDSIKSLVEKLSAAFRDVKKFLDDQQAASMRGEANNIGRDPLVRGLRSSFAQILGGSYPTGGAYNSLAQVGFSFSRTGDLEFNAAQFEAALSNDKASVKELFRGSDGKGGVFGALASAVARYTDAGGLVPNAQDRLTAQSRRLSDRISVMEERLEVRRLALQREFIAADQAMSQLNAQRNSLSSLTY